MEHHRRPAEARPSRTAISPAVTVALASLQVPRVVLHDLGALGGGNPLNAVLAIGPVIVWVLVAAGGRVANPVRALTWVGLTSGVLLAATHQLLWSRAHDGDPPELGGNLRGELPEAVEDVVVRTFAVASSLATGVVLGVGCGLVALALLRRRTRRRRRSWSRSPDTTTSERRPT